VEVNSEIALCVNVMVHILHKLCCVAVLVRGVRVVNPGNYTNIRSSKHIICPVLASMYRAGDLKMDADGNVEIAQIYETLTAGLGWAHPLAHLQSHFNAVYDKSQKGIELSRNMCAPPSLCYSERSRGVVDDTTKRWFNVYAMNGKQTIEHGISTGIRGGDTNMPPNAVNCEGKYPCEKRFDQFFGGVVSNGRFYLQDMMKVICRARKFGDRGGQNSYSDSNTIPGWNITPAPGREWEMKAAMAGAFDAFGRRDENNQAYLTMNDWKALYLKGRYPRDWQRRDVGCQHYGCKIQGLTPIFTMDVPCDVGYDEPFWQNTGCEVYTGRTCDVSTKCLAGETCAGGRCLCGRGQNMRTMCFKNGACREQEYDRYSFWGEPRTGYAADNPEAAGNP
jgi:hypothetical protein